MSDPSDPERDDKSRRDDPWARSEYRRLIAWDARIRREGPFLTALLDRAPERSVIDIGCGTGEHVAFFARCGARALGVDRSADMIGQARDHETRGEGRFVVADAVRPGTALDTEPPFGLAICLGNMLPHLTSADDVDAFFDTVRERLVDGGLFVVGLLNYARILEAGVRHLPLNFRPADDEAADGADEQPADTRRETVFLRLMRDVSPERILFFPTTLSLDPQSDEPVRIVRSRRVELRPWTADDLVDRLTRRGFDVETCGDLEGGAFDAHESMDLVLVATRSGEA